MKIINKEEFLKESLRADAEEFITDILLNGDDVPDLDMENVEIFNTETDYDHADGGGIWITCEAGEWDEKEDWLSPKGKAALEKMKRGMETEYARRMGKFTKKLQKLMEDI